MDLNQRLASLDVFRGITVAAMILVNNPGSWEHVYPPLLHAPWHGCTPTDLIFPFFLFSMGMSIHFAYAAKAEKGLTQTLLLKIIKRALIIFALGFSLNILPDFEWETVRIPGVLQRISIVFLVCALLYLTTTWITQLRVSVIILLTYYLLLTQIPVPGTGTASLDPETNLGAWLDRLLLSGHLWVQSKTWDPEGVLSTLPSIATGISGMLVARLLVYTQSIQKRWLMFAVGAIGIGFGHLWSHVFPLNKSLWTSSFVLFTSGVATVFIGLLHWLIDVRNIKLWSKPFVWYGANALAVFVGSGLLVKILIRIQANDTGTSVWSWIHETGFASWLSPVNASLAFALFWVVIFGIILYILYRKRIIIKV